jgi:hypothetical protein
MKIVDVLRQAERFVRGFEGDELQQGIDELLAGIRQALISELVKKTGEANGAIQSRGRPIGH